MRRTNVDDRDRLGAGHHRPRRQIACKTGTANLSCGPGCGWNLIIQVAKNRQIFNVVDVDHLNPGNYVEGTAIHQ